MNAHQRRTLRRRWSRYIGRRLGDGEAQFLERHAAIWRTIDAEAACWHRSRECNVCDGAGGWWSRSRDDVDWDECFQCHGEGYCRPIAKYSTWLPDALKADSAEVFAANRLSTQWWNTKTIDAPSPAACKVRANRRRGR